MASSATGGGHYIFLVALFLLSSSTSSAAAYGELSPDFYATKCPSLDQIIKAQVNHTLVTDGRRMGASLLRLFFHDCFVQGCDASVLLDNDVTILSEKMANPNRNSLRGFDVIDRIKREVEKCCPGVVSCADILALVTKQAVVALGGQGWPLLLGRRDSMTANMAQADSDLPSPNSDLDTLIKAFGKKNFTPREMVALSGSHTIGLAQCTNVDESQKQRCSIVANNNMLPLDVETPEKFDNLYYGNLLPNNNYNNNNNNNRGLLRSDRVLVDCTDLKDLVGKYAENQNLFFQDFANAMKKMSEMSVLTGTNGQIRSDCSKVNH